MKIVFDIMLDNSRCIKKSYDRLHPEDAKRMSREWSLAGFTHKHTDNQTEYYPPRRIEYIRWTQVSGS